MELFEPYFIKNMYLKNRIVMSPMACHFADEQCKVTEKVIKHYSRRAAGGVGMIIVEGTVIDPIGLNFRGLGLYNEDQIEGMTKLTKEIKKFECKVVLQMHHAGRLALLKFNGGIMPVAPSAIPVSPKEPCRELSLAEIEELVNKHLKTAKLAKEAGFDGVEIHGAHGLLIAQFLSSRLNKREDLFGGGTVQERCYFPIKIVNRIRQELGQEYLVSFRISGDEFIPDGIQLKEVVEICKIMESAGVDLIDVSGGSLDSTPYWLVQPMMLRRGCLTELAAEIKKNVQVPVMVVGRINNPTLAEEILQQKKADLIGLGRPLLADPDYPLKAERDDIESIRKCIACNSCVDRPPIQGLQCAINPKLGRDEEFVLNGALKKKKVLVVGGGARWFTGIYYSIGKGTQSHTG